MIQAETSQPLLDDSRPVSTGGPAAQPVVYSSDELLQGRREVWIEHGDQMYRLRVTSAKKLYLTK
jgi:hemin uptake protein HemP